MYLQSPIGFNYKISTEIFHCIVGIVWKYGLLNTIRRRKKASITILEERGFKCSVGKSNHWHNLFQWLNVFSRHVNKKKNTTNLSHNQQTLRRLRVSVKTCNKIPMGIIKAIRWIFYSKKKLPLRAKVVIFHLPMEEYRRKKNLVAMKWNI